MIRPPGVWLLIEPEATLYICRDILLRLQVQPGCLICNHNACLLSIHNSFRPSSTHLGSELYSELAFVRLSSGLELDSAGAGKKC